jgi:hypothetical protein
LKTNFKVGFAGVIALPAGFVWAKYVWAVSLCQQSRPPLGSSAFFAFWRGLPAFSCA